MIKIRVDGIAGVSDAEALSSLFLEVLEFDEDETAEFLEDLPSFCYVGDDKELAASVAQKLVGLGVEITAEGIEQPVIDGVPDGESAGASIKVYGNMDWFRVVEQPEGLDALPEEFASAKKIWSENGGECTDEVMGKLAPFVGATFSADNLEGWEEYFSDIDGGECEASKVRVVGLDFTDGPIPLCRAEAWFDVPLKAGVSTQAVSDWAANDLEGAIYMAISFCWEIEGEGVEDLDLTSGDHSGAEGHIEA